jgi:uncharacterized integral membrane protein
MNQRDYTIFEYGVLFVTLIINLQFLLFVWFFQVPFGWELIIFLLSVGVIGLFLALFIEYRKLVYVGEMKRFLKINISLTDKNKERIRRRVK